jgi:hypothetical protein
LNFASGGVYRQQGLGGLPRQHHLEQFGHAKMKALAKE